MFSHPPLVVALLIGLISPLGPSPVTAPHVAPSTVSGPSASGSPSARWTPPLGIPMRIATPYRAPEHPFGPGHRGVDLLAGPDPTVVAPADGTVSFAGRVVDRGVLSVRVDAHTVYSIEPVSSDLEPGDPVIAGAPIATVSTVSAADGSADTAHCAESCLHLGVRVDDAYVDPMRYLIDRPVLLPW